MKLDHLHDNTIRAAIDDCLSGVAELPSLRHDILYRAKGEMKVKKKLSLALVTVLLLALAAATALAVVTLREQAKILAQTEQEQGWFADWTTDKKIETVRILSQGGYVAASDDVDRLLSNRLTEEKARRVADQSVAAFTGREASEVTFLSIMQAAWGPFDQWTYEEKAWYSSLMADVGERTDGITYYVEPQGPINEQQALAIARREVAKGYGVTEGTLDTYQVAVTFEVPEATEQGDKQPYWGITFAAPENMPEGERLFILFPVYVHPETGELLWSVESMLSLKDSLPIQPDNDIYRTIHRIQQKMGDAPFRTWPVAAKAMYSQEIRPLVQAVLQNGDLSPITYTNSQGPDVELIARTTYAYGVPGNDDIPQEKAYELAKDALHHAYEIDLGAFALYSEQIVYFDTTDPERPLWKFLFNGRAIDWHKLEGGFDNPLVGTNYKAEIDARTGDIVHLDTFVSENPGWNLSYDVKLH